MINVEKIFSMPDYANVEITVVDENTNERVVIKGTVSQFKDLVCCKPDYNPLTMLPGNHLINAEITRRIMTGQKFAVLYLDLDYFKCYNDCYGFSKGDEILKLVAEIIKEKTKDKNAFIGNIGGDDFICVVDIEDANTLSETITNEFDNVVPSYYKDEHRNKRCIEAQNRKGDMESFPLMTLSIGIVTNENRKFYTVEQVSDLAAEVKKVAKRLSYENKKSCYFVDRRGHGTN